MRTAAALNEFGFPPNDELPEVWSWKHVNLRLVEAFEALPNLRGDYSTRASAVRLDHLYDDADLLAQDEADEETKAALAKAASRASLSPEQVSRVLAALNWPADYLAAGHDSLARMVGRVAKRVARGMDFAAISRDLRLPVRYIRNRYMKGCELIAARLREAGVAVF